MQIFHPLNGIRVVGRLARLKVALCISASIGMSAFPTVTQATPHPKSQDALAEETAEAVIAEVEAAIAEAEAAINESDDAASAALGYLWHETNEGTSVQYGVPESDDRAFRIDCFEGRINVIAPAHTTADDGSATSATFEDGERRDATIHELGNGPNFVVSLATSDPVIATLLAAERIRILTPETSVSVPTAGGTDLIRALVDRCQTPQR